MRYFSEVYHESTQYIPHGSGDPVIMHWEKQPYADKRYTGCQRFPFTSGFTPLLAPVSADYLNPVCVYAVVHGIDVPDGVYFVDCETSKLVKLGGADARKAILSAFPEPEFITEAQTIFLYTGLLERAVWRFREASYRQVQMDVGSACANTILLAKSRGQKVFPLGGFVDDAVAVALKLGTTEMPMAAIAVFPEKSMVAFNSVDDGVGELAYSNHAEMNAYVGDDEQTFDISRYPSRFMLQNHLENIDDLNLCMKVRRLNAQALPGDEFPLTPSKFTNEYYLREFWYLPPDRRRLTPFSHGTLDLDDFSSMLRWLELAQLNAFGAGLIKIWVVVFDVMFVYSGVYRYIPLRKSIYMQGGSANVKKFCKCFAVPEQIQNTMFAVVLTSDLNESCNVLGNRGYRYMNLNAGVLTESLYVSARLLNKVAREEHFFYHDELKKLLEIPESESILSTIVVGKSGR
jgi:SagB-type dehydrogenase family enzyme